MLELDETLELDEMLELDEIMLELKSLRVSLVYIALLAMLVALVVMTIDFPYSFFTGEDSEEGAMWNIRVPGQLDH